MRILLLSNMYPSAERPEYGVFVSDLADALRERGHEIDEAVLRVGRGDWPATPCWRSGRCARRATAPT